MELILLGGERKWDAGVGKNNRPYEGGCSVFGYATALQNGNGSLPIMEFRLPLAQFNEFEGKLPGKFESDATIGRFGLRATRVSYKGKVAPPAVTSS